MNKSSNIHEILTTGDIAKFCGVNYRTVNRWVQRGELKGFQLPGRGDVRVRRDDFLVFLKTHNIPVPNPFQVNEIPRILIVEDTRDMATAIQRVLQGMGLETQIAGDGFRAGVLVRDFNPHLVTLDLKIPGFSGLEVLRYIRNDPQLASIRLLVISALPEAKLQEAKEAGADDIIGKPFENEELTQKVMNLLNLEAAPVISSSL